MREAPVEQRLKSRLESHGFSVVKLVTPGTAGAMDRFILRPRWSPGPPWLVECKRPGGPSERRLQELRRDDWRARGVLVLPVCDSYIAVELILQELLRIVDKERIDKKGSAEHV
jgi:hypothetical protein